MKFQLILNQNINIFVLNVTCKMVTMLPGPQCDKLNMFEHNASAGVTMLSSNMIQGC